MSKSQPSKIRKAVANSITCGGGVAHPRANGAKRRSGRKPGARVTNFALAEFKVVAHGS